MSQIRPVYILLSLIWVAELCSLPGMLQAGEVAAITTGAGHKDFDQTTLSVGYNQTLSIGKLDDYWTPSAAPEIQLSFPYQSGRFTLGFLMMQLESRDESERSDVNSNMLSIGYMNRWKLYKRVEFEAGAACLLYQMLGKERLGQIERNYDEKEAGLSLQASLGYRIAKRSSVSLKYQNTRVFTYKPTVFNHLALIYSQSFSTPRWLKWVLK